jgi:hypothetical protein
MHAGRPGIQALLGLVLRGAGFQGLMFRAHGLWFGFQGLGGELMEAARIGAVGFGVWGVVGC